jgi:hypothetical protein
MSTVRRESPKYLRDADGKRLCSCGCGRHPVYPRRNWFSQECVEKWREVNDQNHIRYKVFARDKGVCAICGCDTERVKRRLSWSTVENRWNPQLNSWSARYRPEGSSGQFNKEQWDRDEARWYRYRYRVHRAYDKRVAAALEAGWPRFSWPHGTRACWEADHIVPVIEGGGQCTFEGFRTLCVPCHKNVTRELHARLKERRRHKV